MRLETALYTSYSGLKGSGDGVALIGDNIANANTTGFKAARPEFVDVLGAALNDRVSATDTDSRSGVKMSSARTLFDNGVIEQTGRTLDAGISGNGFFQVGTAENPEYTRVGAFEISTDGILVTGDGKPVLGLQGTGTTLGPLDMYNVSTAGKVTSLIAMTGNLAANGNITDAPTGEITSFQQLSGANYQTSQAVYDAQGARHDVQLFFYKKDVNTWTVQTYMDGGDVGGTKGVPVKIADDTDITFSGNGIIEEANQADAKITATPEYSGGATAGSFTVDLSNFTQYASTSIVNSITQDGLSAGNVQSYQFAADGTISAVLDTGTTAMIGKLQLAMFPNLDGLNRNGSGTFSALDKAGDVFTGSPGSTQFGTITGGALERSTVDLAEQFSNLILQQRAYQANASIMKKADEMLQQATALI